VRRTVYTTTHTHSEEVAVMAQRIVPNLWFDTQAVEAAEFYCSVFPNSRVTLVTHYRRARPARPARS
jgi:predicted 3-demethylubiquinone-9 3-methyltransferase (glyoxalase superfamily)